MCPARVFYLTKRILAQYEDDLWKLLPYQLREQLREWRNSQRKREKEAQWKRSGSSSWRHWPLYLSSIMTPHIWAVWIKLAPTWYWRRAAKFHHLKQRERERQNKAGYLKQYTKMWIMLRLWVTGYRKIKPRRKLQKCRLDTNTEYFTRLQKYG